MSALGRLGNAKLCADLVVVSPHYIICPHTASPLRHSSASLGTQVLSIQPKVHRIALIDPKLVQPGYGVAVAQGQHMLDLGFVFRLA